MAEKRFVEVYSQGMTSIYKIIVDTHTGVNYLIAFNAACGSGMTVLLDAEESPSSPPCGRREYSVPRGSLPRGTRVFGRWTVFLHMFFHFICRKSAGICRYLSKTRAPGRASGGLAPYAA